MCIVNEEKLVRNIHAFIAKAKMATWSLIPLHSARARTPEIFYFILLFDIQMECEGRTES